MRFRLTQAKGFLITFKVAGAAEPPGEAVLVEVSVANGAGNCVLFDVRFQQTASPETT